MIETTNVCTSEELRVYEMLTNCVQKVKYHNTDSDLTYKFITVAKYFICYDKETALRHPALGHGLHLIRHISTAQQTPALDLFTCHK